MKGVILAGGKGSRMSPLTLLTPKPLVPIMNIPVIDLCISWLKSQGVTEIAITIHHLATKIQKHCGDGRKYGVKLVYFYEKDPMGTAGGLQALKEFIDGTFIVVSSDVVNQFNLQESLTFHFESRSECTVITTPLAFPEQYGIVIKDKRGKIRYFQEKPPKHLIFSDQINTGIYIIEPSILKYIPSDQPFDFSHDLFPLLLQQNVALYSFTIEGYWIDIGQMHTYHQVHRDNLSPLSDWIEKRPYKEIKKGVWVGPNCMIDPLCRIEGPVLIGEGCQLGANTNIGANTVIGNNCLIESGCNIEDSILWDGVQVRKGTHILSCVISSFVLIEEGSKMNNHTIVSDTKDAQPKIGSVTIGSTHFWGKKDTMEYEEKSISEFSIERLESKIPFDAIVTITKIHCPKETKTRMVRMLIEGMIDKTTDMNLKDGIQLHLNENRWVYIFPYEMEEYITIYTHAESIEVARLMAYDCRNQITIYQGV
jgi:mannose-1-phosphate guanylyltransferase / phosphomannomutase